jgi:hypothetical protein
MESSAIYETNTPDLAVRDTGPDQEPLAVQFNDWQVGTLAEIDSVDERLGLAAARTAHERRLGALVWSHLVQMERIDERQALDGRLLPETAQARVRLNLRVMDLLEVIGRLAAEHHAQLDGARLHLRYARQAARIDTYVADSARLEMAGLPQTVREEVA